MRIAHYSWKPRAGWTNAGDELGLLLLKWFTDYEPEAAGLDRASVITIGSILDLLPKEWQGTVLGSGILRPSARVDLNCARVLALRGPKTARLVKNAHGPLVLGDPGLLADELVHPAPFKEFKLGLVPHWSDTKLEQRPEFKQFKPLIIRPTLDPLEFVRQIGTCEKIVASSLHGIIIADAFGIPRRTEMTERFAAEGGSFKFEDYNASIEVPFKVGLTQIAPRSKVEDRQHELFDAFRSL